MGRFSSLLEVQLLTYVILLCLHSLGTGRKSVYVFCFREGGVLPYVTQRPCRRALGLSCLVCVLSVMRMACPSPLYRGPDFLVNHLDWRQGNMPGHLTTFLDVFCHKGFILSWWFYFFITVVKYASRSVRSTQRDLISNKQTYCKQNFTILLIKPELD